MSQPKVVVWGNPATRANRPLWLLRELGVSYDVESKTHFHSDEFAGLMKKQPALVDTDGTVMFESLAINLYLIRKYGGNHEMTPSTPAEYAGTYQWSMFAMTELDPRLFELLFHSPLVEAAGHPLANDTSYADYFGRQRSANRQTRLQRELEFPLRALDDALTSAGTSYLIGNHFTVADLNLAIVVEWARFVGIELAPRTQAWLDLCMMRPLSPRNFQEPNTPSIASMSNPVSFANRYGSIGAIDMAQKSRL